MALTLKINGKEFINYVKEKGLKWTKNDLDDNSERTMDGRMHRNKITEKIKLDISLETLNNNDMRGINTSLNNETIQVTYCDPLYGEITKTFYGTSIKCGVAYEEKGVIYWENGAFSLTEV